MGEALWSVPAGTPQENVIPLVLRDFMERVIGPAVAVEGALHEHCTDGRCLVREQRSRAEMN